MEFPKKMSRKDEVSRRIRETLTNDLDKHERVHLFLDEAVIA